MLKKGLLRWQLMVCMFAAHATLGKDVGEKEVNDYSRSKKRGKEQFLRECEQEHREDQDW